MYSERKRLDETLRKRLDETLNRKDYLITVYECGDEIMSGGDIDRQVLPGRYFERVSLNQLKDRLDKIYIGFWTHPDLKEDFSNEKEIPFEEKKFGIVSNIFVEPLSEELEERYLRASERGFFKNQRLIEEYRSEK
jgi:hypothetical protein